MASLWAPRATYSPRRAESEPSRIATTLVAPRSVPSNLTSPSSGSVASPGFRASSGRPNSFATEAVGRRMIRGWVAPGGTGTESWTISGGVRKA